MMAEPAMKAPPPAPVAVWREIPFNLAAQVADSMAHPAIKNLFKLWGGEDSQVELSGYVFTVDSDDLSVSTEFTNNEGDWCSLSLSGDGLVFSISNPGEHLTRSVSVEKLDQVELFEEWYSQISLH